MPRVLPRRMSWPASCCSCSAVCSATWPSQVPSLSRSRKPPRWPREHECRARPGSASTRPSTKPGIVLLGWSSSEPRSTTRCIGRLVGPQVRSAVDPRSAGSPGRVAALTCSLVLLGLAAADLVRQVLLVEVDQPALQQVEPGTRRQGVHDDAGHEQRRAELGDVRVADGAGPVGDEDAAGADDLEQAPAADRRPRCPRRRRGRAAAASGPPATAAGRTGCAARSAGRRSRPAAGRGRRPTR